MITSMTKEYQSQYEALFTEAFNALLEKGLLTEDEKKIGRFSSLEQYFTRIADLYDIDPKYVMLLPLDEPYFEINANTREIGIPTHFKKYGVSVQGDSIAETLLFSMSRFVDAFDMDEGMEAYIQWEIGGREGHSKVDFTYIDKDPELLVFAWPLTNVITRDAGILKFSARFVKKNADQVTYSFNTLPATVEIKKALKADLEYSSELDTAEHLFKNAIANTVNTSTGGAAKISIPDFAAAGAVALPTTAYLKNDQVVLMAQAIVTDAGEISYRWTYAPLDTSVTAQPGDGTDVYKVTSDTEPVTNKRYYKINTATQPTSYDPYPHDEWNESDLANNSIYERFAAYTILAGETPVVGSYKLVANNRVGFDGKNTDANNSSPVCVIPGPEVLNFQTEGGNLAQTAVLTVVTDDEGNETQALALDVAVDVDSNIPDDVDGIELTYEWEKTITNPLAEGASPLWVAIEETTAALEETGTDLPGWYRVKVTSKLNRATKSIESEICKVTAPIKAPDLAHPADADPIIKNVESGAAVVLNVALATEYSGELESEGLTYEWYVGDSDNSSLLTDDENVTGQGTDTLHISYAGIPTVYRCEVTNHLKGQESAKSSTGNFIVM